MTTSGMRWYKGQSVPFMNVFNPDSQVSTATDVRAYCNMHVIKGRVQLCNNCIAMPSPAMPCHALLCPAMPCPAMPCPAMPCPAMPCPAMPCPAMPCPASPAVK